MPPLVAKQVQLVDDLAPVGEGVAVAAGVAAVGLLDVLHAELDADAVPDQSFQPVERVEYD
jgi:hypothetical protein